MDFVLLLGIFSKVIVDVVLEVRVLLH
jgi:hypothetical protein